MNDLEQTLREKILSYPIGSRKRNEFRELLGELFDRKGRRTVTLEEVAKDMLREKEAKIQRQARPNDDLEYEAEVLRSLVG